MRADLKALADLVIQALKSAVAPLVKRLDEVDLLIKTMPEALAPSIEQTVKKAVDALPPAKDGVDGQSVTPEDLAPLIADEVSKAVALLPKPDQVRRMVDEEVAKAMALIPPAKDGENGRDALQLELQPAIDLEKSYPRGTYARHAGGLWRAFESTKGLHGWECIVDGIAELRIEQPSGREFTLVARTSSGAEVSKSIKVAALVDKGVFRAEESYEAGDGVTWGGSFFIAQKDAPIGKPGEPGCDGWRLAVKRGRDAGKAVQL